jgi:hypothetical protein
MPAADTVLFPLCVALSLIGLIITGFAWRRGNRGRVVQGVGLALAPVALFLTGLLRLVWNAVVAVGTWAGNIVFSPAVWAGLLLLGLCVVLWVVGGFVARRTSSRRKSANKADKGSAPTGKTAAPAALPAKGGKGAARTQAPVDDDMAEIEALLKSRGIE